MEWFFTPIKYIKFKKLEPFDIMTIIGLVAQVFLGLLSKNEMIYFVYPVVSNLVYALIFGASLIAGRDMISFMTKDMCDDEESYTFLIPAFRN